MTPASDGLVEANGVRLHYLRWGLSGPPAVLLHATGFLARLWEPIAEGLARRYRVYAYDTRGHGDSDKPEADDGGDPYGWEAIAGDLNGFLDAMSIERALLVGHSGGGAQAAYLAATRPRYVERAVLIEPIISPPQPGVEANDRGRELSEGAAKRRMVWPSREELIETYRQRPAFAGWRDEVLRLYAEHGTHQREDGQFELKCPGAIEARFFGNSLPPGNWDLLPEIRCPTLVVRGETTDPPLAAIAAQTAERIPGARLATIAGAGHFAPMEKPDEVLGLVASFVESAGVAG